MTEKVYMTWNQFDSDINSFISIIENNGFADDSVILALKRGGYLSATALSNRMDIPVSTVAFQTRDGDDVEPRFLEPEMIDEDTKIILPDDIYDTGLTVEKTVEVLVEKFSVDPVNILGLFHYGSVNLSNTSLVVYDSMRSNKDTWVVFPWE